MGKSRVCMVGVLLAFAVLTGGILGAETVEISADRLDFEPVTDGVEEPQKKLDKWEFDSGKAMMFHFDSFSPELSLSRWKANEAAVDTVGVASGQTIETTLMFSHPFHHDNQPRHLMVFSTPHPEDSSKSSAPSIGVSEWFMADDGWQNELFQPFIVNAGSWGTAPDCEVSMIGEGRLGLIVEVGSTAQGYMTGSAIIIGKVEGKYQVVLELSDTMGSNEGAVEDENLVYGFSSEISIVDEDVSEGFYRIRVYTSGTRIGADGSRVEPFTETKFYKFSAGKYKLAS